MSAMNPQLGQMLQNPMMRSMLSNPEFLRQMSNPATIQVFLNFLGFFLSLSEVKASLYCRILLYNIFKIHWFTFLSLISRLLVINFRFYSIMLCITSRILL